ncbi:MAG: TonB-dependent receptor [Candidatus Solibacter sp.]
MKRSLILLLSALLSVAAFAQTDSGSIRVLVSDSSTAPIAGALVKLTNVATGVVVARETGEEGYAMFSPIVRGDYTADVAKPGFQSTRVKDIQLEVDDRRMVRVTLPPASVTETIEVSAAADIVQSEQASLGQVIRGSVAVELPLAARRYTDLALLVPGATESTVLVTTRGPGWFVVNGNYQAQNNFIIDGVDNNQGTTNAQSLSAQVVQPSPDAISEFKVQTNSYSAEFGRSAGAAINVVIKSGTNQNHGSAWYYNRDATLAATPWSNNLIGAGKPDLKWHQFGGTLGGPVVKNKLFYFGDYEGFRRSFADAFLVSVPSEAEKSGVFYRAVTDPDTKAPYPNNTIPQTAWDPLGKKLIDLYPKANQPGSLASSGQTANNYGVTRPGTEDTHKADVKGDYNFFSKDIFSARWSYFRQDIYRDALFDGPADGANNQGGQFNSNHSFGGTWTGSFTPSLVNVLRFGYNRTYATFTNPGINGPGAAAFGFKNIPTDAIAKGNGGIPQITVSNYNSLGTRNFRPQFQSPELFQFIDSLSVVRGRHTVRVGFETRQKNNLFQDLTRTVPNYSFGGRFTGLSMADLLVGYLQTFDANTQTNVEQLQKAYAGYIQDDWKVSPSLTLNLGLRYEYTTPFYGKKPIQNVNFDPAQGKLVYPSSSTDYLLNADHSNIGPRIGAAYQIVPQKLVFRGGYGIFFSGEDIFGSDINLPLNPPQLIPITLTQVGSGPPPFKLSEPVPNDIFSNYNTSIISLRAREKDFHTARVQQFNTALQYLVAPNSTFEAAYVGNRGKNLQFTYALNQTPFGVDGSVAANRPYPQWSQITMGATRAHSWYNSLQLKFERQMSQGLYTLASYTYASAIDEAGAYDAGTQPQYLDNLSAERGPQSQTARQRFTWTNVYQLPIGRGRLVGRQWNRLTDAILGGWQISNILSTRTGLPINVTLASTGVDPVTNKNYTFLSRNGGGLRPNRAGEANSGIDPKSDRLHFLDGNAFAVQAINTPGNAQRNVALGPKNFTLNLSLVKRLSVTERSAVDLRFEAFNAFNTVNFSNPNTSFGSSTFGSITSAGDARQVQLAVRYSF